MKKITLLTFFIFCSSTLFAQEKAVILSASATSSSADSSPITCLLDANCTGFWSPGSKDSGADEGLYFQFDKATQFDQIKVQSPSANQNTNPNLRLSLNGKNASQKFASTEGSFFVFQVSEKDIKSAFIKIEDNTTSKENKKLQFSKIEFHKNGQKLPLQIPRLIPSSIAATSILEPQIAYYPSHLFDAKNDFAWATDGKKNDGVGESFSLRFAQAQNIAGFLIWNGYQRSPTHFKGNGRVLEAEVMNDTQKEIITLQDTSGVQKVMLKTPLQNSSVFHFKIKKIQAGEKYKDVLISELRFLNAQGEILLPQVEGLKPQILASIESLLDQSYSSFLHQPVLYVSPNASVSISCDIFNSSAPSTYFHQRIRLRKDGSFVIYKWEDTCKRDKENKPFRLSANVLEGNWEVLANGNLRLFGKRYPNTLEGSEYLKEKDRSVEATIFQTELKIKKYQELSSNERKALLTKLWKLKNGPSAVTKQALWCDSARNFKEEEMDSLEKYSKNFISGGGTQSSNFDEMIHAEELRLSKLNPIYLSSSVLEDFFLPIVDTNSDSRECRP